MACLNLLKKNTTPMKIMTSLDSTLKTKIVLAPFKTTTRGIRCRKYTTKLTTCSSSRLLSLGMQSLPHSAEWAHKQTIGNLLLSRKSFFGIYNSIRITPSISSKKKLKIIFSLPTKWWKIQARILIAKLSGRYRYWLKTILSKLTSSNRDSIIWRISSNIDSNI